MSSYGPKIVMLMKLLSSDEVKRIFLVHLLTECSSINFLMSSLVFQCAVKCLDLLLRLRTFIASQLQLFLLVYKWFTFESASNMLGLSANLGNLEALNKQQMCRYCCIQG